MATSVSDTDRQTVDAAMAAASNAGESLDGQIENAVTGLLAVNVDLFKKAKSSPKAARDDALSIIESVLQSGRSLSSSSSVGYAIAERHAERVANAVIALSAARSRTTSDDVDTIYHNAAEKLLETDERLKTLSLKEGRIVAYGQALDLISEALSDESTKADVRAHEHFQMHRGTADYERELITLAAQRPDTTA